MPDMEANAKSLNYYTYGSAAPTIQSMIDAETRRMEVTQLKPKEAKKRIRRMEKIKAAAAAEAKAVPGISVFAVLGTLFVSVLMVFVVLAQINYNETAGETARLSVQLKELTERHRVLELAFESVIDIKEVERYARDELGMSRPDAGQIVVINTTPRDSARVVETGQERGVQGFGSFIRSLTDYFR